MTTPSSSSPRSDNRDISELAGAIVRGDQRRPQPRPPAPPRRVVPGAVVPLRGPALLVQILLGCWVGIGAVAVVFALMQRSLLERVRDNPVSVRFSEVVADGNRVDVLNAVFLSAGVITGVAFIVWFRRAYRNLDGLGEPRRHALGWAIGAWFCPIVNLWYPKQIADDMWAANQRGLSRVSVTAPPKSALIYAWWCSWLAVGILGYATASRDDPRTVSEALSTNTLYLVRDLLLPAAAVFAILVVRRITAEQAEIVARASE